MDHSDLLFLHSMLSATIRTQQDQIAILNNEVQRLNALLAAATDEKKES